ncbi:DNA-binding transcriptional regulator HcaR [Novosphingobium nitrogenifigens DSM 19370]|uniref:DNA-binding transcriptional regulator HcaR n=1 Tax=Novosphingobium nitrogenifigens DSM 19370 TaxID=983920 RepID=F1Z781_9SPHN|nr:LysR substrate-binding domain-containing protein [Novosphingobium nitrogenifigens]EGD59499.1 DNA-binding transcriptional regulator HcaR [Novosphingobium nitrogenifigens DSM 19370]
MELRHLRYFVAVAEALSFTRAAQTLRTAQPSLSQQIRDLEYEIGTPLLNRDKRNVALTAAGKVFLDEARLVLAQADRAKTLARRAAESEAQSLTIGFVPAAEVKIFPQSLTLLRGLFPDTRIVLRSLTTFEQHQALLAGDIDIAFMRPPVDESLFASEVVLREPLVALLHIDHPACALDRVALSDLTDTPFLRIASRHAGNLAQLIDDLARRDGAELQAIQEVENVLTLLTLVGLGVGFSILPDYVEQLSFRNLTTRPLAGPEVRAELVAAWRHDNAKPEITALVALTRDALSERNQ